jgi:predicted NBD/HSP70 family sugar kinase/transcriptional regulator with XRE-family HTH domain
VVLAKERAMDEQEPPRIDESSDDRDDLGHLLAEIAADPVARAGYEDALHRDELLQSMVTARGNLTQKAVGAAMGTTQSAISDIESGRVDPRISTLQRYARAVDRRLEVRLRREDVGDPLSESTADEALASKRAQQLEEELQQARKQEEEHILDDILTYIYKEEPKSGPQSTAAVAENTGLREPAVGHTMHRLLETGWLNVDSPHQSRELRFSLSDERGLVLGVSVNRDHVGALLTSLRTTRVIKQRQRKLADTSPRTILQTVVDLVEELRGETGPGRDIIGLGVALAGRVDGSTGTVFFAPDLEDGSHYWNAVPLEADLEDSIRARASGGGVTRVVVENDANALGMYEYLRQGEDQSICIVLMSESGEGIGAGLVVNHAIAHGTGGMSGEIGHVIVEPGGEPCRCGNRGCLEVVASPAAIVRKISATASADNLAEASALVERGNRAASEIVCAAGEALGRVLSNVSAILGPARLVIFGPPELTQEPDLASACTFLDGVRRTHGQAILGVKVNIEPRVLEDGALSEAAAATAVHYFLSQPQRWVPTITDPELLSSELRGRWNAGAMTK